MSEDRYADDLFFNEIRHMNRANEARTQGNESQAKYHQMMAGLAANRLRVSLDRFRTRGTKDMDIPKDKNYPADAVQCDDCGGNGCLMCGNRGWFADPTHPKGRRCHKEDCGNPIPLAQVAVYCSNECAAADA